MTTIAKKCLLPVLLASLALASCDSDVRDAPENLVVSVLPDQSSGELLSRFTPLVEYLEATTGQPMTLVLSDNYADLLQAFIDGDVQLAFFGGLTFVRAEQAVNAEPLVMRDVDVAFRSCYVAHPDDPRQALAEFENSTFSFGSKLSTSGHLMPRYFMQQSGVVPETFFKSIVYSGTHDRTAFNVADSVVEFGVMNCSILEQMMKTGAVSLDRIRIIEKTPAYVDYVWAVQEDLDEELKRQLVDAFLALDSTDPAHAMILSLVSASVFLPAGRADFEDVRRAAGAVIEK